MDKPIALFLITLADLDVRIESALLRVLLEKKITLPPTGPPYPVKEFFTEKEAREFLGNISRSLFFKLKNDGRFNTYHCGQGRCLYSREELIAYIKTNKPTSK